MGVLGEDPAGHQGFGGLAAGHQSRIDVDPGPQASATNGGDSLPHKVLQARVETLAELAGALLVFAFLQQFDDFETDRASERVTTEGGAVLAGLEHVEDIAAG